MAVAVADIVVGVFIGGWCGCCVGVDVVSRW